MKIYAGCFCSGYQPCFPVALAGGHLRPVESGLSNPISWRTYSLLNRWQQLTSQHTFTNDQVGSVEEGAMSNRRLLTSQHICSNDQWGTVEEETMSWRRNDVWRTGKDYVFLFVFENVNFIFTDNSGFVNSFWVM